MPVSVTGIDKVLAKLQALSLKGKKRVDAEVGYKCPYAVFVHENLEMKYRGKEVPRYGEGHTGVHWGVPWDSSQGESKFLEKAYRRAKNQLNQLTYSMLKNHRSLREAVERGAYLILNLSNTMVPVDTGRLYSSGYVKVKEGS